MLDIGLLHHLEELARVGREELHVAALSLGVDGVEGEGRLARAREAGDDRQALARDVDVDALEVVLARTADGNVGQHRMGFVPFMFLRVTRVPAMVNAARLMWVRRRGNRNAA